MENTSIVTALSAIAQESRLNIFRILVQAGPAGMAAGKISTASGIAPSSLSFHLKELAHAQMVIAKQEGRFVYYSANFATMNTVIAYLTENCCGGNPCSPVSVCDTGCDREATQ
jgi:DNA-binding transcriptional ArsR family regulator